ncbi:hypothetical protein Patl1_00137 [Pistacia atlantica]|uniref:Uncharacterized protein n=1 Tax=Pistacia atlantica TaxID=434234 RepID=A0ACC1C4E9_9ROSI|nr:hypothetical protein Patl1_00137 [Pistacia atlantica]
MEMEVEEIGGYAGDFRLMPVKAFGIAASASIAFLRASGIHKVEDLMEVGANIRTRTWNPL